MRLTLNGKWRDVDSTAPEWRSGKYDWTGSEPEYKPSHAERGQYRERKKN